MGGLGIFAAAVLVLGEPPLATSRVQLTARGDFGFRQLLTRPGRVLSGGASLSASLFAQRPVVDDETPISLQPFLQRAGVVHFSAGGGGSDFDGRRARSGGASAGFDLYLRPWAAITASFGVGIDQFDASPTVSEWLSLPASIGVGLRWQDVRIDARYRVIARRADGQWRMPYFGNLTFEGVLVHQRRLAVYVGVDLIEAGAIGTVQVTGYLGRRLGLFAGLLGGYGVVYADLPQGFSRFGGFLGVSAWSSRHLGGSFSYAATWTSGAPVDPFLNGSNVTHSLTLTVHSRVR